MPTTLALKSKSVRLVIADVDGTLVTSEKRLTAGARSAVRKLHAAGIKFAITSGRPPRGMSMLVRPLQITTPIAAFNGGLFVRPDLTIIDQKVLPADVAHKVLQAVMDHHLDVWVYRGQDWWVLNKNGPHVERESWTVKFKPKITADMDKVLAQVVKIVGVSDDFAAVARAETDVRRDFGQHVSAARSQPYYLDITHPDANKGGVVRRLSRELKIPMAQIATIGDMPNDVLMFALSGISIAMGNADSQVQRAARHVTASNEEDGFALAVEKYIL